VVHDVMRMAAALALLVHLALQDPTQTLLAWLTARHQHPTTTPEEGNR
jgi:hypothetical protein